MAQPSAELRDAIERLLGGCASPWNDTMEDDIAAYWAEISEAGIVDAIAGDGGTSNPPAWWRQRSKERLRALEPLRHKALAILDLSEPIALEDLPTELEATAKQERKDGDQLTLEVPFTEELPPGFMIAMGKPALELAFDQVPTIGLHIYKGYSFSALVEWMDATFTREEALRNPANLYRQLAAWVGARHQPLARIHGLAREVSQSTGCQQWEAIAFLLSARDFEVPWVTARIETEMFSVDSPASISEMRIRLVVGCPQVPASAVAAAYSEAVERLRLKTGAVSPVLQGAERDQALKKFVEETSDLKWAERFEQWNARRDVVPFASKESMRTTFQRIKRVGLSASAGKDSQ